LEEKMIKKSNRICDVGQLAKRIRKMRGKVVEN
jgi:hypothetical protein